ncbi:septum formation inhibitor Maf [Wenzhouxiangella sp. XN79A]|uniref:Maf family protein n=1 Tax=Wenzhouxiangella sp. XN79A TaxID=2724193 RepID=UPI00144A63F8|nr:Maf family protein [Wenzhouxiangella sp. XN79A]NKI35746.1 septum formation inhibitor Maf [Wenzhouxiangella sp. XN79A]
MNDALESSPTLVLASGSPRRRELLAVLIERFEVRPADIDESVRDGESPSHYVQRMAREKAAALDLAAWTIGADTSVVLDGSILGKPSDAEDAVRMLRALAGRTHHVHSAVALRAPDGRIDVRESVTAVEFAALDEGWMARYVASGDPLDKAGAYGIQGAPAAWIRTIDGSHSGVVGLPLFETAELLRAAGFDPA